MAADFFMNFYKKISFFGILNFGLIFISRLFSI